MKQIYLRQSWVLTEPAAFDLETIRSQTTVTSAGPSGQRTARTGLRRSGRALDGLACLSLLLCCSRLGAQTVSEFQPAIVNHGRAVAVAVDPANRFHALVASESGGLFQTIDRGRNWAHVDGLAMFRMRDVQFYPGPRVGGPVIATGWADSRVGNRGGLWRSVDGGTTWSRPVSGDPGCWSVTSANGIAFEPLSGNVFVGTDCGLAISRDYGVSWTHVTPNASANPDIYCVAAQFDGLVDIAGPSGHQRSTNSGVWFDPITRGSPAAEGVHGVAVSPLERNVVFVAGPVPPPTGCSKSATAVFEGDYDSAGTVTWNQVCPSRCRNGRTAWVATSRSRDGNPDHFDIYFGSGQDTWRQTVTRRGGTGPRVQADNTAWELVTADTHGDQGGMAFDPYDGRAMFLVSDGGVYLPADESDPARCGGRWKVAGPDNNGYHALQIYQVTGQMRFGALDRHVVFYFGTQDNSFWSSDDSGVSWPVNTGNEGCDIQVPRYAEWDSGHTVVTWKPATAGAYRGRSQFSDIEPWLSILGAVQAPYLVGRTWLLGPNVYVQLARDDPWNFVLWITRNEGTNWTSMPEIPLDICGPPQVSTLDQDVTVYFPYRKTPSLPSGDSRIGLCKVTGIRRDGTLSSPRTSRADVSGLGSIGQFALGDGTFLWPFVWGVDPNDPSHLIADDVEAQAMKVSTDGGATWTVDDALTLLITGRDAPLSLPQFRFNIPLDEFPLRNGWRILIGGINVQAHAIAFDPYHRGHILVGTEAAGLIRSTNNGASWTPVLGSRKMTAISSIFFVDELSHFNAYPEAVVATYGRGLWKVTFTPPPPATFYRLPSDIADTWARDCWLRLPGGGCADLSPSGQCDGCIHYAVLGGTITDIVRDANGIVLGITTSGGRLIASSQDGQPVAPPLYSAFSQNPGNFSDCPACLNLIQQGGAIRGLVLDNGRLRAILGGFGPLPGEPWLTQFSPASPQVPDTPNLVRPVEPYLQLMATGPNDGGDTAYTGESVIVAGGGFCGAANCQPVLLQIGDRIAAVGVTVDQNGNFQTSVTMTEEPGGYEVTAIQPLQGGQTLTATARLIVAIGEAEEEFDLPQPELFLHQDTQGLWLSWSASAFNYVLEQSGDPSIPASWQPAPAQVVIVNGERAAFLQPTATANFYRLRKP